MPMVKVTRAAAGVTMGLAGIGFVYLVAALVLGLVPVNRGFAAPAEGIEIFVVSNGVHAGFAVPLVTHIADLSSDLPPPDGPADAQSIYVMVGWGDGRVYPATRTWSDLTAWNTISAFLGFNGAVMHVEHVGRLKASPYAVPVRLSNDGYGRLVAHIRAALQRDADGQPIKLAGASHGRRDRFYRAVGRYSPFHTCNDWVREGLKAAGVRTAVWSPFQAALFFHLPH